MEHEHLDAGTLERLLALDRTEDQNRSLLHQIAVCPMCHRVGGWLLDLYRSGALTLRFGVVDAELARSRAEAPALWEMLVDLPHERRLTLAGTDPRFASWGLAELLCRKSRESALEDTVQAIELAELAVLVSEAVEDDQPAEAYWTYQLRALAWSSLGNARRVGGDLDSSDQAVRMSDSWWVAGAEAIGDVLGYEPVLMDLKASLRISQRKFQEAFDLLDGVKEMYLNGDPAVRDPHLAGRALILKAHALIEMGATERAIEVLREAERLVEPERSLRLLLCLRHDLVYCLVTAGHYLEAELLLPQVQSLSESHGSRVDRVRLRWVEARIVTGLGDRQAARLALEEVRQDFLSEGIVFDAALATLDLVVLDLEEGNTSEVKALAAELVAVFQTQKVRREALAALLTFQRAAAKERATVSLAREVAVLLERSREDASPIG